MSQSKSIGATSVNDGSRLNLVAMKSMTDLQSCGSVGIASNEDEDIA
jgi:hypothetical protein